MAVFEVKGTHPVPLDDLPHGQKISLERLGQFEDVPDFQKRGCYIYWIKFANGARPIYVGKTTQDTFAKRPFHANTLLQVQNDLNSYTYQYSLHLYLLSQRSAGGRPNTNAIDLIEPWLIHQARTKNPNLINRQHVAAGHFIPAQVEIAHILNSTQKGPPPLLVREFKSMMGL